MWRAVPDRAPPRILAGSGRSGTTWILDALAEANELRPVFEPLHPSTSAIGRTWAGRWLDADDEVPELAAWLEQVCHGAFRQWWADYRVRTDRLRPSTALLRDRVAAIEFARRWRKLWRQRRTGRKRLRRPERLVKLIRANLMLPWLARGFGARCVLLVRHPGAVVESQLRLGGDDWAPVDQLGRYLADPVLGERLPPAYRAVASELANQPASAAALNWCIENELRAADYVSAGVPYVHYEHLQAGDEGAWSLLLASLGLDQRPVIEDLRRPSQQAAVRWDPATSGDWSARLDSATAARIDEVLQAVHARLYRMRDPVPLLALARSGPGTV